MLHAASCMITLLRVTFRFESFVEIYPLIISLEIVDIENVRCDIFRNIKKKYLNIIMKQVVEKNIIRTFRIFQVIII